MKIYRKAKTEFKIRWIGFNVCHWWSFIFWVWDASLGSHGYKMYGFRILGFDFDWFYIPALTA